MFPAPGHSMWTWPIGCRTSVSRTPHRACARFLGGHASLWRSCPRAPAASTAAVLRPDDVLRCPEERDLIWLKPWTPWSQLTCKLHVRKQDCRQWRLRSLMTIIITTVITQIQPQWTVFSMRTKLPGARDPCPVPEILQTYSGHICLGTCWFRRAAAVFLGSQQVLSSAVGLPCLSLKPQVWT